MLTRWLASPALRCVIDRAEGLMIKETSLAMTETSSVFSTGSTSRNQPLAPRSTRIIPTTLTTTCVTNPAHKSVSPKAVTIGQNVVAGISICFCGSTGIVSSTTDYVYDCENDYPHGIDEMPIPGDHFDVL